MGPCLARLFMHSKALGVFVGDVPEVSAWPQRQAYHIEIYTFYQKDPKSETRADDQKNMLSVKELNGFWRNCLPKTFNQMVVGSIPTRLTIKSLSSSPA